MYNWDSEGSDIGCEQGCIEIIVLQKGIEVLCRLGLGWCRSEGEDLGHLKRAARGPLAIRRPEVEIEPVALLRRSACDMRESSYLVQRLGIERRREETHRSDDGAHLLPQRTMDVAERVGGLADLAGGQTAPSIAPAESVAWSSPKTHITLMTGTLRPMSSTCGCEEPVL